MNPLFHLGDKFLISGIVVEVVYINHGKAWLSPVVDGEHDPKHYHEGSRLLKGLAFTKINKLFKTPKGALAVPLDNNGCAAL